MNKKILLIGNTSGLPGVIVDIESSKKFFKTPYGGKWNDSEIIEKIDVSKATLEVEIAYLKFLSLDFLIVVFSGHGGQIRETVLELNSKGEYIGESKLQNIAKRQINIYDCCRVEAEPLVKGITNQMQERFYSVKNTRERYEKRIMEAISQQVSLYACKIGETAIDTADGGVYTSNLLASTANFTNGQFKLVGDAHQEAAIKTSLKYPQQHPDANLPKCLSSQQLILSINPNSP